MIEVKTNLTKNKKVLQFVKDSAELAQPDKIVWIDGSEAQRDALRAEAVATGEMIKLNEKLDHFARLLSAQNRRKRRSPRGRSYVHLLQKRRRRYASFHRKVDGSAEGV